MSLCCMSQIKRWASVHFLAAALIVAALTACGDSTGAGVCEPPEALSSVAGQGTRFAAPVAKNGGYVVRDRSLTVVGLCGLRDRQILDVLPTLTDNHGRHYAIGASLIQEAQVELFDLVLMYPATSGRELVIDGRGSEGGVPIAPVAVIEPGCSDQLLATVSRLECGLATVYRWETAQAWTEPYDISGAGVEVLADPVDGVDVILAAPTDVYVQGGVIVVEIALVGAEWTKVSGLIEFELSDAYSEEGGRKTFMPPARSGRFPAG